MLPTTLLLDKELTLWDSVLSRKLKISKRLHQEVEEVEEEEEEEEVEEEEEEAEKTTLAEDKEDKIQSNPSRKPKKISQPYEREDLLDLPSKELADSINLNNRLLTVLKRFS